MLVLNMLVFICMLFVQVTTKNFPEGTLSAHFQGRRPFWEGVSRMITIRPWQLRHQSFYKLGLSFLMEVARHVQSMHYF